MSFGGVHAHVCSQMSTPVIGHMMQLICNPGASMFHSAAVGDIQMNEIDTEVGKLAEFLFVWQWWSYCRQTQFLRGNPVLEIQLQ